MPLSSNPLVPPNFGSELMELERRIRALETTNQLLASTIKGGALTILDDAGAEVARIGQLADGTDGIRVASTLPTVPALQASDAGGLSLPWLETSWYNHESYKVVTSGTFVDVYRAVVELASANGMRFRVSVGTDAGVTGELRVLVNSVPVGDVKSTPAGTSAWYDYRGPHGVPLQNGPISVTLQARRVSGTANVNIYPPTGVVIGGLDSFPGQTTGWL